MTKKPNEYSNFENLAGKLVSVSHSEIKAKLDAEKAAKKRKKSKKTRREVSSASKTS
jgi:hypothetical protein